MWYRLYQWSLTAFDWMFPPECGGCGEPGTRWCVACEQLVRVIQSPCRLCGQTVESADLCPRCAETPPALLAVRSWAEFDGPIREAWHRVKYHRDIALADSLAQPLLRMVRALNWPINLIVPVPLSRTRLRQRGYNQADLLARPLAWGLQIKRHAKALRRKNDTRSQVGLTRAQRKENVADAFQAAPRIVAEKQVLLVDDVATSGATLNACAEALWQAGAESVYGLTLARAVLSN